MALELTEQQTALINRIMELGLYETEAALLEDGLKNARAKSAAWRAEMERRDREDARIPAEQVYAEIRRDLEAMYPSASEIE